MIYNFHEKVNFLDDPVSLSIRWQSHLWKHDNARTKKLKRAFHQAITAANINYKKGWIPFAGGTGDISCFSNLFPYILCPNRRKIKCFLWKVNISISLSSCGFCCYTISFWLATQFIFRLCKFYFVNVLCCQFENVKYFHYLWSLTLTTSLFHLMFEADVYKWN